MLRIVHISPDYGQRAAGPFVTFVGQAMLFSSFTANLPWNSGGSGGTYNYFYGVGLMGPTN